MRTGKEASKQGSRSGRQGVLREASCGTPAFKDSGWRAIIPPDPPLAGGRTRAVRGVLWLSVGSWGSKGAQTVVLLVLAHELTPSKFGIVAIAALTYNILSAVNELGVSDALVYRKDRIGEASRTALSMVLVSGLVLMGVAWVLAPVIASFFHTSAATFVVRGFAVCLPLDAAAAVPIGRLTRSLSFSRRAVTDTLPSLIGAGVTIGVAVSGYPLIGLVAGRDRGIDGQFGRGHAGRAGMPARLEQGPGSAASALRRISKCSGSRQSRTPQRGLHHRRPRSRSGGTGLLLARLPDRLHAVPVDRIRGKRGGLSLLLSAPVAGGHWPDGGETCSASSTR